MDFDYCKNLFSLCRHMFVWSFAIKGKFIFLAYHPCCAEAVDVHRNSMIFLAMFLHVRIRPVTLGEKQIVLCLHNDGGKLFVCLICMFWAKFHVLNDKCHTVNYEFTKNRYIFKNNFKKTANYDIWHNLKHNDFF